MKKIIDGKLYNTDTAAEICSSRYSNRRDFSYCWETLCVTGKGAYFLYGEGGPNSKYSVTTGLNEWSGGEDITLLTAEEARIWTEEHGTPEEYIEFFGEPEEAGKEKTYVPEAPSRAENTHDAEFWKSAFQMYVNNDLEAAGTGYIRDALSFCGLDGKAAAELGFPELAEDDKAE